MKRILLSASMILAVGAVNAQMVNDTVTTGAGYANNVWYSLQNDDAGTAAENNWVIGLSTTANPMSALVAATQFNRTLGQVYAIPDLEVADFADADTAGLSTWTPLQNTEYSWASGAMNNAAGSSQLDYGFGNYNTTSHNVDASRVFIFKPTSGAVWKFTLTLESIAGNWKVTYAKLDNSDLATLTVPLATYSTKNFIYVNFANGAIVDREPASANWDLWFGRYNYPLWYTSPFAPQTQTGVFTNVGVEIIQVDGVDQDTYVDYTQGEWTDSINLIGADWKSFTGGTYVIEDETVYFINDKSGSIWKLVMTYFSGTSAGKYGFAKQKITSVGIDENGQEIFASLYPNPAAHTATVVVKNIPNGKLDVYSMTGALVYSQSVNASALTAIELPVADFNNGVYQVVCTSGSVVSAQRLVVQH